jgi:hypothetical protein
MEHFLFKTLVAGSKLDIRDTEPLHCELLVITIQFQRLIMNPPPPPLVGVKVAILSMAEECMLCENVCFFVHFWSVVSAWLIIVLINNQILLKMLGAKNSQIRWNYSLKKMS